MEDNKQNTVIEVYKQIKCLHSNNNLIPYNPYIVNQVGKFIL